MTPQPCFVPLSIQLRMMARRNERDVCCHFGAVHAFVAHWLSIAETFSETNGGNPAQIAETVLSQAQQEITRGSQRESGSRQAA